MKKISLLLMAAVSIWSITTACSGSKATPISDLVKKSWSANIVKENSVVVYTKGAASNTRPGYSSFKLDLSAPPAAVLTEFDGNTFSGTYTVTDTQLTLSGLNPQPSGTGGTISFTINSTPTATQFNITRTTASQKTGGTTNDYQLVNP